MHELLALDRGQAWRTDAWSEGSELVLRLTPAAPEAELARVRPAAAPGVVARARFDTQGRLDRLTVRDARKAGAQVRRTAPAAERTTTLATARFGSAQQEDLLRAARGRQWTALGVRPQVIDADLVWRTADGDRERAVWQVRLTAQRGGSPLTYVASLDPIDGSLLELTREGVR